MLRSYGWMCLMSLALCLGAATAGAEVELRPVEYRDGELVLQGWLAIDASAAPDAKPGVLLVHEWWGVGEQVKRNARRLAELGYAAFALDMYGKDRLTKDPKQAGIWAGELYGNPELMLRRFTRGLETLKAQPGVDPARIAAIGYCFGGSVCLEAARAGAELAAVVSFHGKLTSAWPEDARKPLRARVLVCHGADDPMVPVEQVTAFAEEMRRAGADWQLNVYGGAVHSFTNPEADGSLPGARYQATADRRSWAAMRLFLEEAFAPPPADERQ